MENSSSKKSLKLSERVFQSIRKKEGVLARMGRFH